MAHLADALALRFLLVHQTSLHLAADAAQRRRRQHALGGAAGAEIDIDQRLGLRGGDHPRHVAVAYQHDPRARFPRLGDQFFVPVAVQDAGHQVGHRAFLRPCQVAQIGFHRIVEVDDTFRQSAAHRDLVHVDVGGMEEIAALGQRHGGDGVGAALGGQRGALQRIDGDVHLGTAGADLLADEQHRGFVHLTLANDDGARDLDGIEPLAHGLDRRAIGVVLMAPADPLRGGERRGLGHADQFQGEVAIGDGAGMRRGGGHDFLLTG